MSHEIVSFDPGDLTGWARWDVNGDLLAKGILNFDELLWFLADEPTGAVQVVVYERFRLQRARAVRQSGSSLIASQVIGAIKLFALQQKIPAIGQEIEARDLAAMHTGIKRPSDHKTGHDIDAVLHGCYYLETLGIEPRWVL